MAYLTKNNLTVVETAFQQINALLDEAEASDDLYEAIAAAEEVTEGMTVGGQIDAGDVEVIQDALTVLHSEIPLADIDSLDYEITDALDELEELLRTVATPAPALSPVSGGALISAPSVDDELSQAL